jgi:hypothetical protein
MFEKSHNRNTTKQEVRLQNSEGRRFQLKPHTETIASLVVLVAFAAAIADWVTTGSERIRYAGLQIAVAFFVSVFQGYAPDTDVDNVRDRVVGILLGLSSPHSSSITSGLSALESNRESHSEVVAKKSRRSRLISRPT